MLHCLRSIAGNSSGPPGEFCEIFFIASMISSLVILMSDSVFQCGYPKRSFGYLIVIVGSGVLKTLLHCSFSRSLIFFSYSFVLNSFKTLLNISVGQSGGGYTLIITILRFFMCMSWYSTYELEFAIRCSASTASVALR